MSSILVLLDIGNTSITYGVYSGGRLHRFGSDSIDNIPLLIKKCLKSGVYSSVDVVISSVVPKSTQFIKTSLRGGRRPTKQSKAEIASGTLSPRKDIHIHIVGKDIPVPIKHKYRSKKKLGIDRLVNLYGAMRIYQPPILVIDFGTAITLDYLSKKGVFEGGMIIPGPEISFQTLLNRAALIPKSLRLPEKASAFLGRDTYSCMRSGILEGFGAMTDELIRRFRKRYGKNLQVIATGGFIKNLKPYTKEVITVDPKHAVKSLLLLYKSLKF